MNWAKWKIRTPMDLLGWLIMLGFALIFVKCSVGEISLLVQPRYAIARVYKVSRTNKLEMMTHYAYVVRGERYTGGQAWDEKAGVGDRYVVQYGEFEPIGSSLLDVPVPDSIQRGTGAVWQRFLVNHNLF
jgi:hypothetical protein